MLRMAACAGPERYVVAGPGFAGLSCTVLVTQRQAVGGSYDTTTVRICNTLETRTVDSGLLLSKNASPWRALASTWVG